MVQTTVEQESQKTVSAALRSVMDRTALPDEGFAELAEAAASLHDAGRLKEAERLYRKLVSENRHNGPILSCASLLYRQLGHIERARGHLEAAVTVESLGPTALRTLGSLFAARGYPAFALAYF